MDLRVRMLEKTKRKNTIGHDEKTGRSDALIESIKLFLSHMMYNQTKQKVFFFFKSAARASFGHTINKSLRFEPNLSSSEDIEPKFLNKDIKPTITWLILERWSMLEPGTCILSIHSNDLIYTVWTGNVPIGHDGLYDVIPFRLHWKNVVVSKPLKWLDCKQLTASSTKGRLATILGLF